MRKIPGFLTSVCAFSLLIAGCGDAPTPPPAESYCSTPISLRRGEVREISGAANVSCVVVAATAEASEYLFVTANATAVQDNLQLYSVSTLFGSSANVSRQTVGSLTVNSTTTADSLVFASVLEARVREMERANLSHRSLSALDNALRVNKSVRPLSSASAAARVGDTLSYRVGDAASSSLCNNYKNVRAVVKAVGSKALIMLDANAPSGGFSSAEFAEIAAEFDSLIYPVDAQWFGESSDVNADGHITILFTPEINRLTPTGSLGYAGGFFFASDLLPRSVATQNYRCDASNEQEIMFLLAPDPNGQVNGNRFSIATARESARGTTAHELQHMINQGVRQRSASNAPVEVTWLNEALSHFAEEAVGRAARGYADSRKLTWNDALRDLDDFDSFFRQNFLRLRLWMQRPDLSSPVSAQAGSQLAPRGAAWALVRYAIDRYAGSDAKAFTRALVAGPQTDIQNLEARTRVTFEQLLPGFLIANFGDSTATGFADRYTYAGWSMRDAMSNLNGGMYPLQVTPVPVDKSTQSLSGSGNYYLLTRTAGAPAATFRMLSTTGGSVGFTEARVYVARVK